jgi:tetratricopeptide (TPR) repeat protein
VKPGIAACVLAVAILAHLPHTGVAYTYDDHPIVERNPRLEVHDGASLLALVRSNYWGAGGERTGERLFRPVPLLSYAAERAVLGRPDALFARWVNAVLHALCSLAAFALFAQVARSARAGFLGALVFAAHPLHAECVAGVVGRAEILALGFALLALERAGKDSLLAFPFLLLALGSKESAVAAIPIALARDLLERRLRLAGASALLGAFVVYVGIRAWAIGSLLPQQGALTLGDMPLSGRLVVALAVYRDAWIATLLPLHASAAHYPFPNTNAAGIVAALSVQVACLLAVSSLRRSGPRGRAVALGVLGFELALLPVSNVIPIGVVFAERLLYAPTAWAALAVGALLEGAFARFPRPARIAFPFLVGALALGSLVNDRIWTDDDKLWHASLERFPDQPRSQVAVAEIELHAGRRSRAIALLERAVELTPDEQPFKPKALAELGLALAPVDRKRSDDVLKKALKLAPMNPAIWLVAAHAYDARDDEPAAREAASRAVGLAPENPEAHMVLGLAELNSGHAKDAVETFTRALEAGSDRGAALFNRAEARWAVGDIERARADYREAARLLGPDPPGPVKKRIDERLGH